MRILITLAGLGLILGGCTAGGVDDAPTRLRPIDARVASPNPIPGRDWHLVQHRGQSSLAFGVAESDDLDLGLTCHDGSGRVTLFRDAAPGEPAGFQLDAGGEAQHFDAEGELSPLTDGLSLHAEADVASPVFRRFRDLGWVTLQVADERHSLPAHPGSEERIDRFFAACG